MKNNILVCPVAYNENIKLKNVIERAVILSQGKVLRLDLSMPGLKLGLDAEVSSEESDDNVLTDIAMREFQKSNLVKALEQTNWRVSGAGGAAELLGVRPSTLADRVRAYKIKRPSQ